MSTIQFCEKVFTIAKKIPKGKVASYGQLARLSGYPHAARAVGICMKHNPDASRIPCHRVVASNGDLTGYSGSGGIRKKRDMLLLERVIFHGDRVNLSKSQWKP